MGSDGEIEFIGSIDFFFFLISNIIQDNKMINFSRHQQSSLTIPSI